MNPPASRRQRGYVLVMVMVSLAVIAFVAAGIAQRIDSLRASTGALRDYAGARLQASGAMAVALYWLASQPRQAMGYGQGDDQVLADDRRYRLPSGAVLSVQDLRGLPSVNTFSRPVMQRLLAGQGVPAPAADRYIDVLLDYADLDSLRRLNGAEAADYQALGLPAPRNDYLRSLGELAGMPAWRDDAQQLDRLSRLLSCRRSGWLNPNTAPVDVLRALFPAASGEQLSRFVALRSSVRTGNPTLLRRDFGLDATGEEFLLNVGSEVQVTVWSPGLPQALQYNVLLVPAGPIGPWLVNEQRSISRPELPNDPSDVERFPLAMAGAQRAPDLGKDRP